MWSAGYAPPGEPDRNSRKGWAKSAKSSLLAFINMVQHRVHAVYRWACVCGSCNSGSPTRLSLVPANGRLAVGDVLRRHDHLDGRDQEDGTSKATFSHAGGGAFTDAPRSRVRCEPDCVGVKQVWVLPRSRTVKWTFFAPDSTGRIRWKRRSMNSCVKVTLLTKDSISPRTRFVLT